MRGLKAPAFRGKILLYLLIVIVPFITYPLAINGTTISPRLIREISFYSFSLIICSFLQKSKWLRYFILWCVISWWLNYFMPRQSFIFLTNIFSALVIYIGFKKLLEISFLKSGILLRIVCIGVLFQCVWIIMQAFNFDPVFYPVDMMGRYVKMSMPICGWSGNTSLLGVYFACSAFLFLEYFKIKKIPILFFVIMVFSLVLKNATTAIALVSGGIFYLFNRYALKRKYILTGILILLLLVGFFIYVKQPNFDRLPIWRKLISDGIRIRPFVGSGLGVFSNLMIIDKTNTPWLEAHNDYLQMILEIGLVGLFLFMGFIISRFREFFSKKRNNQQICLMSCLVAYLMSAVSLFPMHIAQLSFYAILFLAILENSYEIKALQR